MFGDRFKIVTVGTVSDYDEVDNVSFTVVDVDEEYSIDEEDFDITEEERDILLNTCYEHLVHNKYTPELDLEVQ